MLVKYCRASDLPGDGAFVGAGTGDCAPAGRKKKRHFGKEHYVVRQAQAPVGTII